MGIYQVFVYLQLLDLLTTLLGFRLGAAEASPFIRLMMHAGPASGVIAAKILALGLGAVCIYTNKNHVIRWVIVLVWRSGGVEPDGDAHRSRTRHPLRGELSAAQQRSLGGPSRISPRISHASATHQP